MGYWFPALGKDKFSISLDLRVGSSFTGICTILVFAFLLLYSFFCFIPTTTHSSTQVLILVGCLWPGLVPLMWWLALHRHTHSNLLTMEVHALSAEP